MDISMSLDKIISSPQPQVAIDGEERLQMAQAGQRVNVTENENGAVLQAHCSESSFRFVDLPPELRTQIFPYLIPHNLFISWIEDHDTNSRRFWVVKVRLRGRADLSYELGGPRDYPGGDWYNDVNNTFRFHPGGLRDVSGMWAYDESGDPVWRNVKYHQNQLQMFLVGKAFSNEAKAMLYGLNTYKFAIDGFAHQPISLRSPRIFGILGVGNRLHLLRNLRSIHIKIVFNHNQHWTVKRLRARLQYFVDTLKAHADDINKRSLLGDLNVEFNPGLHSNEQALEGNTQAGTGRSSPENGMFSLESLAALRGIKRVQIVGILDWYAKCLELCIKGKGGEVENMHWPEVKISHHKGMKRHHTKTTTRKWYHPTLNWKGFAEQNGIMVPDDIDNLWVTQAQDYGSTHTLIGKWWRGEGRNIASYTTEWPTK